MVLFSEFRTRRLLYRQLVAADRQQFFKYRCLPTVMAYQNFKPRSLDDVDHFLAQLADRPLVPDSWFQVALCLGSDQRLIGDIGLHFREDIRQVEIGYTIAPDYQRQGYALEALSALLGKLFTSYGVHRVSASVDPRNNASLALLERLGFRREAHHLQSIWQDESWQDDVVYALLRKEWCQ